MLPRMDLLISRFLQFVSLETLGNPCYVRFVNAPVWRNRDPGSIVVRTMGLLNFASFQLFCGILGHV